MSYIGIGSPIPEIASLPGQTGGEVTVTLDYPSSAVCTSASPFSPSEATPPGGTFAATPSGLTINASTGEVTPSTSTPQAYTISYTVSGVTSQFALTINAVQQSTFSYSSSSFQQIGTATPTLAAGTTAGGTYSAPAGVSINTSTGVIDLAASTIGGPYTITYTTPGPCATSSTFNISITAVAIELIDNNFAMEFDSGSSQYISNSTNIITGLTTFSISAWYSLDTTSGDRAIIGSWNTAPAQMLLYWDDPSGWRFLWSDGSSASIAGPSSTITGQWHHIVVTYDGSTVKFYHDNGTPTTSAISRGAIQTSTNSWNIGADNNGARLWDGDLDEIAIWNRALDATDVARIYNATNDNPGKTANLWSAGLNTGLVYWNRMGD